MQTGITVDDTCVTAFNDLKTKKASRYIIMQIEGDSVVKITSAGARDKKYEDLIGELKKEEPAYAIFDFEFEFEGAPRSKMLFISWVPDTAKIKAKTVYAATKGSVVLKLGSSFFEHNAADYGQASYEAVLKKCLASTR